MGRKKIYTILILAVLLPVCFAGEASWSDDLKSTTKLLDAVTDVSSTIGGIFGSIFKHVTQISTRFQLTDFYSVEFYDSAIVPETRAASYFSGLDDGEVKDYTIGAWTNVNEAKTKFKEGLVECSSMFLSSKCLKSAEDMKTELAEGNARAVDAARKSWVELEETMEELDYKGGDLSEYGDVPYDTYTDFIEEYETGVEYKNFQKAVEDYGLIDVRGKTDVNCNMSKFSQGSYWGFATGILPLGFAGGIMSCIEITRTLPKQYYTAYNSLLGSTNEKSGILQILRAKKKLENATQYMEQDYIQTGLDLEEVIEELEEKAEGAENNGIEEINYDRVESTIGSLSQDPGDLAISAKEGLARVRIDSREAERIKAMKQENYLALAIMIRRSAVEEARSAIDSIERSQEIVGQARSELKDKCEQYSREAEQAAVENGLFSLDRVHRSAAKCKEVRDYYFHKKAIDLYLEAIEELKFFKSNANGAAELAREEIDRLKAMIEAIGDDFSVAEEMLQLKKAENWVDNYDISTDNAANQFANAYRIAIAAQNSIWEKANRLFGGLTEERIEVMTLMGQINEVDENIDGYKELRNQFEDMEGFYSGVIDLDALGHLKEASQLYENIRELADYLTPEELLLISTSTTIVETVRCNDGVEMHKTRTTWNPYSFPVGELSPGEEIVESYNSYGLVLGCGDVEERTGWIYADRETRIATRSIMPMVSLESAIVDFDVGEVKSVLDMDAEITPNGIEVEVSWPQNESVEVEFEAPSLMDVYGPACESDGDIENCRYVLSIDCEGMQDVNVLLERPLQLTDSVSVTNGHATNAGSLGIVIEEASCPGHITVDVSYLELGDSAEALLDKIDFELEKLEDPEKEDLTKRYEALKNKTAREVISRGGKLLDEIEEAIRKQTAEKIEQKKNLALEAERKELENWLRERKFKIPYLSSDNKEAITKLKQAKKDWISDLAERYSNVAQSVNELSAIGKIMKKFGIESGRTKELENRFKKLNGRDEYLSFVKDEIMLNELIQLSETEIDSLAKQIAFDQIPTKLVVEEEWTKACDQNVDLRDPEFIISEDHCEEIEKGFEQLVEKQGKGKKTADGTIENLKKLDKDKIYPAGIKEDYEELVESVGEKINESKALTEIELSAAGGDYAQLANENLEQGYINRAYAYAVKAQEGPKPHTALLSFDNSLLFVAPLVLAGAVWQLRKKKKDETPVQKAIRIAH